MFTNVYFQTTPDLKTSLVCNECDTLEEIYIILCVNIVVVNN
jgi:hypothetical protein